MDAPQSDYPYTIALTGGIASGKTLVSNEFKKLDVPIIDTDVIAHHSNGTATWPRPGFKGDTRYVEDGSFLRLSNVTLGYNVPVESFKFLDSVRISLSGQNLWLLTDYSGFDPEVNSFGYDPTRTGIEWGSFPNQRTYTFGINVTF